MSSICLDTPPPLSSIVIIGFNPPSPCHQLSSKNLFKNNWMSSNVIISLDPRPPLSSIVITRSDPPPPKMMTSYMTASLPAPDTQEMVQLNHRLARLGFFATVMLSFM